MSKRKPEWSEVNGVSGLKMGNLIRASVAVDKLSEVAWNANEMSDAEFSLLKETIARDGFLDPVSVIPHDDGQTFAINGGHHRVRAAKALDITEVPCDIMWEDKWRDEDEQKLQSARFNVIKGKMNPEKLLALHNTVVDKFGKESVASLMGYTSQQGLDKIIKQVAKQLKATLPEELGEKFEDQAKKAKSTSDLEKIVKNIWAEYGETVSYNYAVFSMGGKEHIYIAMDAPLQAAMKELIKTAKEFKVEFNALLTDAVQETIGRIEETNGSDD